MKIIEEESETAEHDGFNHNIYDYKFNNTANNIIKLNE